MKRMREDVKRIYEIIENKINEDFDPINEASVNSAKDLIERNENLKKMWNKKLDALWKAFGDAKKDLDGYKKIGYPTRFASDLIKEKILPKAKDISNFAKSVEEQLSKAE